jgi:hypothetical protein
MSEHVYWVIKFEDADRRDEVFTDEDIARRVYEQCLINWNCTLFAQASIVEAEQALRIELADKLAAAELRLAAKDAALLIDAETFEGYGQLHRAKVKCLKFKGPKWIPNKYVCETCGRSEPEHDAEKPAIAKAEANEAHARRCREAAGR